MYIQLLSIDFTVTKQTYIIQIQKHDSWSQIGICVSPQYHHKLKLLVVRLIHNLSTHIIIYMHSCRFSDAYCCKGDLKPISNHLKKT